MASFRLPLLVVLLALLGAPARAQDPPALERVAEAERAEVARVTGDATVSCAVERHVRCRAEVYRGLLTRLPLAARWLRALSLGDYAIEDGGEGRFKIDDKRGAKADCTRPLDAPTEQLVVARGVLEVPVLPRIRGTGVIAIEFPPRAEGDGLACRAKVWFRLDSSLLHAISRALHATLEDVLRDKLRDLVAAATALAEEIERDPTGVHTRLQAAQAAGALEAADVAAFRQVFLLS